MNWYKISQHVFQQYEELANQADMITITGTGQSETINIPGTSVNINARELLERAKSQISSILVQNGVREIDTSPIADMGAQGLKISHEPGKIHIDIRKIFNLAKSALPPTIQTDGTNVDPDMITHLTQQINHWILGEIYETTYHESVHEKDMYALMQQGQPFTDVQEHPAEQQGKQFREKYFPLNQHI